MTIYQWLHFSEEEEEEKGARCSLVFSTESSLERSCKLNTHEGSPN